MFDGVVLSAALGTVILGSLAYNPRLWLNDAPPRARMLAPPLTAIERRDRIVAATVFFLALIAATMWSAARLMARHGELLSFATAFAHFLGVFFLFNLFDLVVIDWVVLLVLRPGFLTRLSVPGLTYEETVGDYGYHFRAFLKGMAFIIVLSLVAAALSTWVVHRRETRSVVLLDGAAELGLMPRHVRAHEFRHLIEIDRAEREVGRDSIPALRRE